MKSNSSKWQTVDLRSIFIEDADTFDAIPPNYPPQRFEDVLSFSQIPASGRILEVG